MKFNSYDLIERYEKGHINMSEEIVPSNPAFGVVPGEKREAVMRDATNEFHKIVFNMETGNFCELDIAIVCLVAQFKYVTSKQLLENLIMMGFDTTDTKVSNSINKLYKNQLVYVFSLILPDGSRTKYRIISLDRFGFQMAQQFEIPCSWSAFEKIEPISKVKKILETNQLRNAYLKSGLKIEWLYVRRNIQGKEKGCIVKPSMILYAFNCIMCFEVVRRGEYWQEELKDKLQRYKHIFGCISETDLNTDEMPSIVFNGEDDSHNKEIAYICQECDLDTEILYTYDILLFGKKFMTSLYTFVDGNTKAIYGFPGYKHEEE